MGASGADRGSPKSIPPPRTPYDLSLHLTKHRQEHLHEHGEGPRKDMTLAVRLYKMAARRQCAEAQCVVGDRVVLWDRMRDRVIDEAGVAKKWGVSPGSIPDLLGLMGDNADGIPGIPRWGQKSCAAVLSVYETIENIPEDVESWNVKVRGAKSLSENLNARRDDAMLYKELAILRRDVPLEEKLEDLERRGADREELAAFLSEIGAERELERVSSFRS